MKLWLGFLEGEYQWEPLVGRDAGSTLFWLVHRHLTSLQPLSSHPSWDSGATCLDMAAKVLLTEGGYNVRAEVAADHQWVLSGCVSQSQEPGRSTSRAGVESWSSGVCALSCSGHGPPFPPFYPCLGIEIALC